MILVTGATGLAGRYIVEELVNRGSHVRVMVRSKLADGSWPPEVEQVLGSLDDGAALRDAMAGVMGIVHAACASIRDPQQVPIDVAAMEVLADAWDLGPFVFLSSLDVYGFPQRLPVSED